MKLDFAKQIQKMAEKKVKEVSEVWLEKLKTLTPEDYWDLQEANQVSEVYTLWTTSKARIFNDDPKAHFVEYSNSTKNYYKDWWRRKWNSPFMRWKGAWMMRRTKFFLENN